MRVHVEDGQRLCEFRMSSLQNKDTCDIFVTDRETVGAWTLCCVCFSFITAAFSSLNICTAVDGKVTAGPH